MTGTQVDGVARGDWQSDHDVSILIGVGAGQEVGWVPSAKVSMMSMRPPQRGQGQGNRRGSSAGGFSSSACFTGGGTFKSARAYRRDCCWRTTHSGGYGGSPWGEAADELMGVEGHRLAAVGSIEAIVFAAECNAAVVGANEPAVGNGDAMGVAGHIA